MKKVLFFLTVTLFYINASAIGLGFEFYAYPVDMIGLNLRISDQLEVKPQMGFQIGERNNFDHAHLDLILNGNYYLPDISELQHYAGVGINMHFEEDDNNEVFINGHYGLRYNINYVVSLFGEIGIDIHFDPFYIPTTSSAIGATFYLPNFN